MPLTYGPIGNMRVSAALLFVSIGLLSCAPSAGSQSMPDVKKGEHFDHVIIVVMENEGMSQALADKRIVELAKSGAWFSNYRALAHPSLPNYLAIVGGSTFGVVTDHRPAPINAPTIVDRLEQKGFTWKAYAEDYPGACYLGSAAGEGRLTPQADPTDLYVRKHVPLLAFSSIQNDPKRCARVVNAREFMRDARSGNLPNYSFYSPNMFNDGHDTSLEWSAGWLNNFVRSLRGTLGMNQRTLLVVTWDEGGGEDFRQNRILTMFIGNVVLPGRYDASLTHYSLLRTIEDNFGLEPLAAGDRGAAAMPPAVWRESPSAP